MTRTSPLQGSSWTRSPDRSGQEFGQLREHRGCSRDDRTATGGSVLGEEVGGAATRLVDDADGSQAVPGMGHRCCLNVESGTPLQAR